MKFLVDSLPYYGESCPFEERCYEGALVQGHSNCPRYWSKDKICSDENPGKCEFLVEASLLVRREKSSGSL